MARLHLLQSAGLNTIQVVVHAPTPAGNNVAGVSWATAIANSGNNVSSMPVGNGPGQISTSENNQVTAGTVIEAPFLWGFDPLWSAAERNADLNTRANQAVSEVIANLQTKLRFFGLTVA